jgi:hypothetical protein
MWTFPAAGLTPHPVNQRIFFQLAVDDGPVVDEPYPMALAFGTGFYPDEVQGHYLSSGGHFKINPLCLMEISLSLIPTPP